jgi:signal transduction histidine kinase
LKGAFCVADLLIVEDSLLTAQLEARFLSEAGHNCRIVGTGREALDVVSAEPPDLVILDYLLPDLDGLKVMKAILQHDPRALVIMVTGEGCESLAAEVMKIGARDYVIKTAYFYEPLVHVVDLVLREEKTNRELREKARQNERLEAQNEVSFWMAHNFRNILSGVGGFLQLIDFNREDQPEDKRIYYQKQAVVSLERAMDLLDQLLHLTVLVSSPPEPVSLTYLLRGAMEKVKRQYPSAKRIELVDNTKTLPLVSLCCRNTWAVALENVLMNAVESMEGRAGRITVSARIREGDIFELKVEDKGRGMNEETRKKAMEPMFSTKGTVGAGMGLSLVLAALRRQGGDVVLESAPGKGTTVTITWPMKGEPEAP